MFFHKVSEDIQLKLLELSDANDLFEITDRSRKSLREWLPWVDGTKTLEDTRSFIQMAMSQYAANNGFQAGIWYNGKVAGCIGFHSIDWQNRKTTIGYWLASNFQGKGIMTRSTRALVDIAFREYELNRVEIRAAVGNRKSRAIPERLGFSEEGCLRQSEWLYDHYVDHVVYSLVARDVLD